MYNKIRPAGYVKGMRLDIGNERPCDECGKQTNHYQHDFYSKTTNSYFMITRCATCKEKEQIEEAIKILEWHREWLLDPPPINNGACENTAEAIDVVNKAAEKQIPRKPKEYEDKYYACPSCGNVLMLKWEEYPKKKIPLRHALPYCLGCGQAIDWSEVN